MRQVAEYLSEELQTEVKVGGVDVSFFFDVVLEDVSLLDQDKQPLLTSSRMVFDLDRISLRRRFLSINKLFIEQANLSLVKYPDQREFNFQFVLDYFSVADDSLKNPKWDVICKSLEFQNSEFKLRDHNSHESPPGFNPEDVSVDDFNLEINDIFLENDSLLFEVAHLSLVNNRQFELEHLSGDFYFNSDKASIENLFVETPLSELSIDLDLLYDDYSDFNDFINLVNLNLSFNESVVDLNDIGYFSPDFYGMQGRISLQGGFEGLVSDIRSKKLLLNYGEHTFFNGDFHIKGLPVIDNLVVDFSINEFKSHVDDIASIKLPYWAENENPQLTEGFYSFGELYFRGTLTGNPRQYKANGLLITDIGKASSDMSFFTNKHGKTAYSGVLEAEDFDLGSFFMRPDILGTTSFNAHIEGEGFSLEDIEMKFSGAIEKLNLMNYNYKNLVLNGDFSNQKFRGSFLVEDDNLLLDFNGLVDLKQEVPVLDFYAVIDHANLSLLNIYQRDSSAYSGVSAQLYLKTSGRSLDELVGELQAKNLMYYEINPVSGKKEVLFHDNVSLVNEDIDDVHYNMRLRSGVADADLHGKVFYRALDNSFRRFFSEFLPSGIQKASLRESNDNRQDFIFDVRIKKSDVVTRLFFPNISISDGAQLNGAFDSQNQVLFFDGQADELFIRGTRIIDWKLSGNHSNKQFTFLMDSGKITFTDSLSVDQFQWKTNLSGDSVQFDVLWSNLENTVKNSGHLQGMLQLYDPHHAKLQFLPSFAYVNDSLWQIGIGNEIYFDSLRTEVQRLWIYKNEESLNINGFIGKDPEDYLNITFNNFNINNLDFLLQGRNLEFDGVINGDVSFSGGNTPSINAGLVVKDFGFNNDQLGDLEVRSSWDNEKKGFLIDANIIYYGNVGQNIPLVASGYFFPDRENDNFDLDIKLENLKVSMFSRYLRGFAQNFRGMASGNLRLQGAARTPELSGKARLVRTGFRVDYLNTSYTFAQEVEIGKDFFHFQDLVLNDTLGQSALVNGYVFHDNFKNFRVDLVVQPRDLVVLNTNIAQNDLYYGKAFVTGLAHIHGYANNIVMDISARTNRGTQIFLPLGDSGDDLTNNFITFISPDTTIKAVPLSAPDISGISLNFELEVTPDAEVQLIFDSKIGDIIKGRGSGNIKLEITSQGSFNMYGDYTIEEGDYLFTLQNLINKRFRVVQGGNIRWTGDPYDADIDLMAAYRLRTSLYDLMLNVDTSDVYRRRVPVETILVLKDKLFNPSITFDISLPGGDELTKEMLQRLITTDQEMNRQVFSLLVLNRFMPTSSDQYNTALGYGVGSTSSELLSNQLSNWLSQISSDFDIGINYRPGDEISSQELEVALSTQLFDDRVTIDGNVGVAGNHPSSGHRTSTLIGDVVVEVKITPEGKFRVKAFNRSNSLDVLNSNSPYTQGVGVFYRREFDSLRELFERAGKHQNEAEINIESVSSSNQP